MRPPSAQNLLVALHNGRRVTIGLEAPETLRALSDARLLACPGCGGTVVLHAGTVRAHHFAHLPGAVCSLPASEPETEEHRAGKLLLADWLRTALPEAEVLIEAFLPATDQRADVLVVLPDRSRVALEYQCAQLSAREWRRRHQQYRASGIQDLWLLGGSRLLATPAEETTEAAEGEKAHGRAVLLRTAELERTLLWDGAPLLFVDSIGERMRAGTLARFRPDPEAQAHHPQGRLLTRALAQLPFPFHLLSWPDRSHPDAPALIPSKPAARSADASASASDFWLWQWLAQRFQVTPETLSPFFGLTLTGEEAFDCGSAVWQAAVYYRFIHRRIGDSWWLGEIEAWARAYLPLVRPVRLNRLRAALKEYQEALAAAGMLSLPMGYGRTNARITADLTTLPTPPDRAEVLRLVRYRRTLVRENAASYGSR